MLQKFQSDQEYYASLPKKRVGTCVLLFYRSDLLIVQPTYSQGWILPGGTVEGEESPLEGLLREIKQELDIPIFPTDLVSVDYIANLDVKGEYLQFLFAAKELTEAQALDIKLSKEFRDHQFASLEKAYHLLTPLVARRVASSLEAQHKQMGAVYLENGKPLTDYLKLAMAVL